MPPSTATNTYPLLSPAELSYLHTSLSLHPPIRPDSRSPTQFRPLIAETDILPSTNGSARICFADGTEAIVGIKAEVEKGDYDIVGSTYDEGKTDHEDNDGQQGRRNMGDDGWVEVSIDMPGFRDDDSLPVFLAAMVNEALLASGDLPDRLWINRRFHWRLYIDILLLSPPLSYPLPLLSLTTHLALLTARLPKLKSELDEDPVFDDDWEASLYLYPRNIPTGLKQNNLVPPRQPPITLLVMAVGSNIIFDPSKEELSVADMMLAVSVTSEVHVRKDEEDNDEMLDEKERTGSRRKMILLSIRTIDTPARLTTPGVPDALDNTTTDEGVRRGGGAGLLQPDASAKREMGDVEGVWKPPRGGVKRGIISEIVKKAMAPGGVAEEVLDGLEMVDLS